MFPNFLPLIYLLLCSLFLLQSSDAKNLKTEDAKDRFLITKWTTEEGLPQNSVNSIVQTQDGYIWLATFGGLARFDGIKFTVFNTANTPILASNRILALQEDKSGTLWIGTETGEIYNYAKGEFSIFRNNQKKIATVVWDFHIDRSGYFWVAFSNKLEKFAVDEKGQVLADSAETFPIDAGRISEDSNGKLWLTTGYATFTLKDSKIEKVKDDKLSTSEVFRNIEFTKDKKIWAVNHRNLGVYSIDGFKKLIRINTSNNEFKFDLLTEKNTVWFQHRDYLLEIKYPEIIKHNLKGFVRNGARSMLRDKDGNLWIGTNAKGLIRLKNKRISLFSKLTTSKLKNTYSVVEDSQGQIWIAARKLFRIRNGKTEEFTLTNGISDTIVTSLSLDEDDNLWYAGYGLLGVHMNNKFQSFPLFRGKDVKSLFFDKNNTLWIGTSAGLWKYENSEFTEYQTKDGLIDNQVHCITQTKDNSIWFGTAGGLSRLKNGKFENFTTENGLSNNFVREIYEDVDGTIWLGTYGGGIVRFQNGIFKAITKKDGLHDEFISRILVDGKRFWILSNRGVFSVDRNELNEVADGTIKTVICTVFGVADGMKTSEASGGFQPAGWKTRDGKLWFPMIEDMVIIDPTKSNKNPPQVVIEKVAFRNKTFDSKRLSQFISDKKALELENGLENLEIEYTGLSFSKPEQIRFFYKLEGLDSDWIDSGTRRTAFYPYLPAGKYKFLVKAVSGEGVSSQQEAILLINVAKAFWQKWWFILLVLCVVIALIIYIYQLRVTQLEKRQLEQENFSKRLINAHESERQRIASELHDGLGQNLLIIKNWALFGLSKKSKDNTKQLEEISETVSYALDETRTIVGNLRPQSLRRFGLTDTLCDMIEQIEKSSGIIFGTNIRNIDGLFADEVEISIYRIVQECLNNVVKHSETTKAKVSVSKAENEIKIEIQDFGKGFSTEKYLDTEKNPDGFGLTSMSQRVKLFGGQLKINSSIGDGTTVSINIKI